MRHVAFPTGVLAMLLVFSSVSAAPPGTEDAPEIVVGAGTAAGDGCYDVSLLGLVGCALPWIPCLSMRYFDFQRVAVHVTLPTGPARLIANDGVICNSVYDFPQGSCTGGLGLDITCESNGWTMFLADDGGITWGRTGAGANVGWGQVTRSDAFCGVGLLSVTCGGNLG